MQERNPHSHSSQQSAHALCRAARTFITGVIVTSVVVVLIAASTMIFLAPAALATPDSGGAAVEQAVLEPSTPLPTAGQPVAINVAVPSGMLTGNVTWSFDDGESQSLPASGGVVHTFTSPGTYTITMSGTDSNGAPVTATTTVRVGGGGSSTSANPNSNLPPASSPGVVVVGPSAVAPPATSFAPTSVSIVNPPTTGQVDAPLTFTAANAVSPNPCGMIAGYRWDFGDGTPVLTGQTVAHAYTTAGPYNVVLTVTDCSGSQNFASSKVNIAPPLPPGQPVSYAAGWNLIGGPTGSIVTGSASPLYTFRAGDTTDESVPTSTALTGGTGYWAYVPSATTSTIAMIGATTVTVPLPAGQFVLIGNPGDATATVTGADEVLVYDPASNGYAPASVLQPGQGAWAYSQSGGTATIASGS